MNLADRSLPHHSRFRPARKVSPMQTPGLAAPLALRDLVIANRILAHEGILDAFGHVSVRHPEEPSHYLIARSLGPELVTQADLQRFTLQGEQVSGDPRPPYAERAIHGALYEARPDVMAVCHNHAPSVLPFGVTDVPLRPIFHMASLIGPEVPVWDIAEAFGETDMLVRTIEQGRSLARALGERRVALMRGHGSVVAGGTLREVVMTAVYMEQNAHLQVQAAALGEIRYLSRGEIERASAMLLQSLASERAWETWHRRAATADAARGVKGASWAMQEHHAGEERARRLESAAEGLLQRLEGLEGDAVYQEPGEGEWSVMKALAHVAEILPYWSRQAQAVAEGEGGQPFGRTHEDPDRIAAVEEHAHDSLDEVLHRLRAGLGEATATLRAIPPDGWARTGRHSRRGEMTVEEIVDLFLIEHVEEHAGQVQAVMDSLSGY